ncbi:Pr6Pr family membrane protein [Psychromicrobium xiongbiense]|uniref:Pr6Pr family membrane protein n=1 Tax=Psychromicrobium xiongbiense TaxID=3051184 RepID=UPI002556B920|nr:Pr6Pr family membrane protein [Psychromicrobium sp. YIM S02556]
MNRRIVLFVGRLGFGCLSLVAISTQLVIHIQDGFNVVNFFSYFTNLSNIFGALVLLVAAFYLITGRKSTPAGDMVRGCAVVCMALVGIVFTALLREVDLGSLLPWINTVLHYVMPIVVVLDWLIQPPARPLDLKKLWIWTLPPIVYLAYSLIRGAILNWYAYPFLNPALSGGYGMVAVTCVGITVVFLVVSLLLAVVTNKLRPWAPAT